MSETRPRFCGCVERIGGEAIPRWDQPAWNGVAWVGLPARRVLKWTLDRSVPDSYKASIAWAWAEWGKVCAIQAVYVAAAAEADIVYTAGSIDGGSNTLAWAELPVGPDRQLTSKIDTAEQWHLDPTTAPPRGRIHLGGVICHENGHLLGLDHDATPERALLDPTYGADVLTPQRLDIKAAVVRYGPAFDSPAAPTPTAETATFSLGGQKFQVSRLA